MIIRSSNRRPPKHTDKNVLLIDRCEIDRCQATREVRAAVLRSRGVEVHTVADLSRARFLWHSNLYDLVMLDVRRYSPGDALDSEQVEWR